MLGNIRLLDSIQKQTINTYHRVLSSRHADFVRKNSTIIAIIAIPTILIAGYAAYHFYNKRHKVTIPPPLPSKKQPKKAQAPISVEDTFGIENFLFSSLPDTLTSEQVSQSIEKISNNVNRQDLKNYLSRNNFENVNKHNYPIAVALALALARHDEEERNGIYLCHKRNAAGFIGDYYRFDQKLYGDLGSNATEFVICVSYGALKEKDKELFNKSIRILATPLLIVAFYEELEEEDQQTFIDLLNDENKALLRS